MCVCVCVCLCNVMYCEITEWLGLSVIGHIAMPYIIHIINHLNSTVSKSEKLKQLDLSKEYYLLEVQISHPVHYKGMALGIQ